MLRIKLMVWLASEKVIADILSRISVPEVCMCGPSEATNTIASDRADYPIHESLIERLVPEAEATVPDEENSARSTKVGGKTLICVGKHPGDFSWNR